jgi:large subunit ribosomal protein L17
MRHGVAGYRLNRSTGQRTALRRQLMTELFRHGRIQTTRTKAQAIRGSSEKLVTLARNRGQVARLLELARAGDRLALLARLTKAQTENLLRLAEVAGEAELANEEREARSRVLEQAAGAIAVHARRQAAAQLNGHAVVSRLFDEIAPRYEERKGGYTRITRLGQRQGDAAPIVLLELIED